MPTPTAQVFASAALLSIVAALASAEPKKKPDAKPGEKQPDATIKLTKNGFMPEAVTIKRGQSVRWLNDDNRDYSILAKDQSFKSGNLKHGESFDFKFTEPGTFDFICILHPRLLGTVTVTE